MKISFVKIIAVAVLFTFLAPLAANAFGCGDCEFDYNTPQPIGVKGRDCCSNAQSYHLVPVLNSAKSEPFCPGVDDIVSAGDVFVKRTKRGPSINRVIIDSNRFFSVVTADLSPAICNLIFAPRPTRSKTLLAHRTVVLLN
jgi:hypothetical protein